MSAATTTIKRKRENLGITICDKSNAAQNPSFESSPNPLRLFPRNIALLQRENVANKTKTDSSRREVRFVEVGELNGHFGSKWPELERFIVRLQVDDDNQNDQTAIKSSSTAQEEEQSTEKALVRVPDVTKNTVLNGVKKSVSQVVCTNTNQTPTCALKRAHENGYESSNEANNVAVNGSVKKYLKIDCSPGSSDHKNICNNNNEQQPTSSSTPSTSSMNGNGQRKRLLSERGEQESQFPHINRATIFNTWDGCNLVLKRNCGIGLYNPMNNCFLNSVLQSVVHIPHLARFLLECNDGRMCMRNTINFNNCFHCGLKEHIKRAIRETHPFQPSWINMHLRKIFPQHRFGVQEDAHEMLTLLLGALEPVPSKKNNTNALKISGGTPSTPIEQIFGGNLRNDVVCCACKHSHTNYERIRELNLGLNRAAPTELNHLIYDFFRPEQLQNFFCSKCQKKQNAIRYTHLLSAPSVLIIQLKRFNAYGGKNRMPVMANPHLELNKYSYKSEGIVYKLHGLIQHIGGGVNFGHYICAMRGFDNRTWYLFDDSDTRQIEAKYVREKMEPYILFYIKIPNAANQQQSNNQQRTFDKQRPNSLPNSRIAFNNGRSPQNTPIPMKQKARMNYTYNPFYN